MPPKQNQFNNGQNGNQLNKPLLLKSKRFSKWVKYVLLFLIIIGITWLILYFVASYLVEKRVKKQIQNQHNFIANNIDGFADWKTYRNEEYGFEFKMPYDYGATFVEWEASRKNLPFMNQIFPDSSYAKEIENRGWYGILNIGIVKNSKPITLENFVNGKSDAGGGYKTGYEIKYLKINDLMVAQISKNSDSVWIFGNETIFITLNENFMYSKKVDTPKSIMNKIISTFKFISTSTQSKY